MIKRIDVNGVNGNPIRVLLMPNIVSTPEETNMVQFYDLRYIKGFTPDGQLISSYHLSTLTAGASGTGLDMYGDQPSWKIDARTFSLVKDWLAYHTYVKPEEPETKSSIVRKYAEEHGIPITEFKLSTGDINDIKGQPFRMSEDDEPDKYRNHYRCSECGHEWDDLSPYTNNDRCPECNAETEPHKSDDL